MILKEKIMSEFAPSSSLHDSQCVNVSLGFKFKPSDEELVDGYLIPKNVNPSKKNENKSPSTRFNIEDEDVYGIEPWNLNWEPKIYLEDNERYYFVKTKKSSTDKGICRKSVKGYHWKNTDGKKPICGGKAWKTILRFEAEAGFPKVFEKGWVIHEYALQESNVESDWVLCRVFKNERKKSTILKIRQPNEIPEIHQFYGIFEIPKMLNEMSEINEFLDTDDQVHLNRFLEIIEEIYRAIIAD